jgi:hypothetical protein
MDYRKKILLCTFADETNIQKTLNLICKTYTVVNNKVIVLYDEQNPSCMYCIYNIYEHLHEGQLEKTILLHRRRDTNTLYTINSLNKLICKLNNGKLDPSYKIDWKSIDNTLLLTKNNKLITIDTKLAFVYMHNT